MLRWVAVEAVHSLARHAPDSEIARFYKRLAKRRGKSKAAVAAAAKLLRVMHRMLSEGEEFAAQGRRPGGARRRGSRSGSRARGTV